MKGASGQGTEPPGDPHPRPGPSPSPICRESESGVGVPPPICRGSGVHPHHHPRFAGDRGSSPSPVSMIGTPDGISIGGSVPCFRVLLAGRLRVLESVGPRASFKLIGITRDSELRPGFVLSESCSHAQAKCQGWPGHIHRAGVKPNESTTKRLPATRGRWQSAE